MKRSPWLMLFVLVSLAGALSKECVAQNVQAAPARKVVNKTVPMYPPMARSLNLSGAVKLEVLVQANGNVKTVFVKGGNPVLVQSAQSAIHGWKWEKTDHDSTEQVEFQFKP
jgi:outer membrane biosynthesis protein TonB